MVTDTDVHLHRSSFIASLMSLVMILTVALCGYTGCGGGESAKTPSSTPGHARPVEDYGEGDRAGEDSAAQVQVEPAMRFLDASVVRVIDGDTIEVRLKSGRTERVRFIGVNTPEVARELEPYGKEAADYTRRSLLAKTVYLELDVGERDKYGRLLAYVWLARPADVGEESVRKHMFNALLLLDGMAQVMTVPPNVRYTDLFLKFQQEAREASRGLWGSDHGPPKKDSEPYYVGNVSSRKFHRPGCIWAERISPKNRIELSSRSEAIDRGFQPCAVCKP